MRRVNGLFVAIMIGGLLSGGVAAASFGTELRTIDTISVIENQISTDVEQLEVVDEELRVTVRLNNPTGFTIGLDGTFVRVFEDSRQQLAYGAGQRVDGGPATVPARGRLTATYIVHLSSNQAAEVRAALREGPVRLTVFHSLSLRDQSFEIARTNVTISGEVRE
ncbi:MAG: hypothetical protein ABEH59_04400 [Halobacteriales archaeon]